MADVITQAQVTTFLGLAEGTDAAILAPIVASVNAQLATWKGTLDPWPAHYAQGAVMLAARLYRRRNSPAGVESFGDLGPVYVQRNDPDVAMLLEIGAYTRPQVG